MPEPAMTTSTSKVPYTYEKWIEKTSLPGRVYGTKSRGPTLQLADNAYRAWAADIANVGNADALKSALNNYLYGRHHLGAMSTDHRDERNKDGIITDTLDLVKLITRLGGSSMQNLEPYRARNRRAILALVANSKLDWDPVSTLIMGVASAAASADSLISDEFARDIVRACEGGTAVVGAGIAVAVMEKGSVKKKASAFIVEQIEAFKRWLKGVFNRQFGVAAAAELLAKAGRAFVLVTKVALKEIGNLASGVADIYEGLKELITDAWTRHSLTLQQEALVTSEGSFAMIRKGIDIGIRNRQVVSGWKIVKGTITTVLSVTATAAAGKIANLVLGAFEFIFKLLYNLIEANAIKKFTLEAKTMWRNLVNTTPSVSATTTTPVPSAEQTELLMPKVSVGTMPEFKAANYTPEQFIGDKNAAYLNFLDSLVNASPLMAAVVMNSGVFQTVDDVLHAATPRSSLDAELAGRHIASLRVESVRLFRESGFTLTGDYASELNAEDKKVFDEMFLCASSLKDPKPKESAAAVATAAISMAVTSSRARAATVSPATTATTTTATTTATTTTTTTVSA